MAREVTVELMALEHRNLGQSFLSKFSIMPNNTHALLTTLIKVEWIVSNKSVAKM